MADRTFTYVFGPVPSRRLGRSLGVDLAPRKVCSFDCVYCQVGRTTRLTTEREAFVPVATILEEIAEKLRAGPPPDSITLSGSGEPTLNLSLGEIIAGIRRITDTRIAILTNGSMLRLPEVRAACAGADVVLPTLDADSEEVFRRIHRPAPDVTLHGVIEGLVAFRGEFKGQIWVEVFIIRGVNDSMAQMRRLAAVLERIRPDRIQLNTAVRPTADAGVTALAEAELLALARELGPKAEVIADFKAPAAPAAGAAREDAVLDMVRRRPVTLQDIAAGLGVPTPEAEKYARLLLDRRLVRRERRGDRDYFRAME